MQGEYGVYARLFEGAGTKNAYAYIYRGVHNTFTEHDIKSVLLF